jgi:hypothetical protein
MAALKTDYNCQNAIFSVNVQEIGLCEIFDFQDGGSEELANFNFQFVIAKLAVNFDRLL